MEQVVNSDSTAARLVAVLKLLDSGELDNRKSSSFISNIPTKAWK